MPGVSIGQELRSPLLSILYINTYLVTESVTQNGYRYTKAHKGASREY